MNSRPASRLAALLVFLAAAGAATYWRNGGTGTVGAEPTAAAVSPAVSNSLNPVLPGDATHPGLTVVPAKVSMPANVRLRASFNDGPHDPQQLTPDQRIAAVGQVLIANNAPDDSITAATLAPDAVTATSPAAGSFTGPRITSGALSANQLASGAVPSPQLVSGAAAANFNASGPTGAASSELASSATGNTAALVNALSVKIGRGDLWQQRVNGTPPSARGLNTAVWTGSEMIVWGGSGSGNLNTGGRYNPATDTWTAMSTTGAPTGRYAHTAVWTGSEMIVWGGISDSSFFGDGARYNPTTNTWTPVTSTGAPTARGLHTAVWTGTEMIVWGGLINGPDIVGSDFNNGACYNPASNTWTPVNTTGAPAAREQHTAVWTGSEMIVWGGVNYSGSGGTQVALHDGARYNRTTNSWTAMSATGAPAVRSGHTALWTGTELVVWGGAYYNGVSVIALNDGARYAPAADTWTAVSTTGAPSARQNHKAVWTGSEMIIWGGEEPAGNYLNDGGRYHPADNSWTTVTTIGAPAVARYEHTAVWTGSEMIVWGGFGDPNSVLNDTWTYRSYPPTYVSLVFGPIVSGNTYTVQRSADLSATSWLPLTGATQTDVGSERTVIDSQVTGSKAFYRVLITAP